MTSAPRLALALSRTLLVRKAWEGGATSAGVSRWALGINSHYSVLDRAEGFGPRRIGGDWPSTCFIRCGSAGCRIEITAFARRRWDSKIIVNQASAGRT